MIEPVPTLVLPAWALPAGRDSGESNSPLRQFSDQGRGFATGRNSGVAHRLCAGVRRLRS